MTKHKKYTAGFQFWIRETDGHFLGKGRVELLELIRETGSITKAAKSMSMSYRQAWQMVEDMNIRANKPLVEKILGGAGGGGAILTTEGEKMIELYHKACRKVDEFISNEIQHLLES